MADELRRKFDELVARYELEPELRDIYVEGTTDKNLVQWFLRQKRQQDFVVYKIDTVEIPAERLEELELSNNNRGRVIALALDMQSQLSALPPHLTCIADKDFDFLFEKDYSCNILMFTDYCSIEMYFFNETILDKFFSLALGLFPIQAKEVLDQVSKVLEELFLIRAANQALAMNMEWLDFKDCCKLKAPKIEFHSEQFIDRYLNKNSQMSKKQLFVAKLQELRKNEIAEQRCKMRGHDFIKLLCWYIIKHHLARNRKQFYNPEIVAVILLTCLEAEHLGQESLFQRLLTRIGE